LTFLRDLESDDRFLLFLHTYSVHDPYTPPNEYRRLFWPEEPPRVFDSSGENLRLFNSGKLELSEEGPISKRCTMPRCGMSTTCWDASSPNSRIWI
jgi:hypothetical protein